MVGRSEAEVFIVDWDLPMNDSSRRRKFYRWLKKLCGDKSPDWGRSTLSVFVTSDQKLAMEVYDLAAAFGKANLYKAELLKSNT